jgi:hypothetical protein
MTEYERWAELSDREATGESLSNVDREFLERFAREDEIARAEAALWNDMADLDAGDDEESALRIADRAVEIVSKKAPARSRRTWTWAVGSVVAAAAAGALFIASGRGEQPSALLELSLGDVTVGGARVAMGGRIGAGKEVTIAGGAACLALEPRMHACFSDGSVVKLSSLGAPQRRLDLVSGRVDVALAPLPQGERFSVVANGTWSTAVGTAFSVEVLANGAVETIVHEGKVRVGGENSGELVIAHKIGLSQGGVKVEDLGDHARTETADWKALGQVAERSIEAPIPVAEAPTADVEEAPASPEPGVATGPTKVEPPRAAPKTIEPPASAAELLALARQALREKRWADAATSYRSIVGSFPSSPEAHTVLVPLANLEVDRLGQAAQGLKHLDAYLSTGGPLIVEARLARIRAFRSLGRTADEASAIDEFLTAHPKSLEAESLKQRRDTLGR